MAEVLKRLRKIAQSDKSALIYGETGTGKDLAANAIHEWSPRRSHRFIAVNCAAIPGDLFESELFGHAKGAFSGAVAAKPGLLETLHGGTAFLDEIGELPKAQQAKMLRLIDQKEMRRVGETTTLAVDGRFLFATNLDLWSEVRTGRFREDLYFRIAAVRVRIPPLRERLEDIPELARHFLHRENEVSDARRDFSPAALDKLSGYDYPGNVRELRHIVERACLFADKDVLDAADLVFGPGSDIENSNTLSERQVLAAIDNCSGNKSRAADRLGISRRQLYRLLARHR